MKKSESGCGSTVFTILIIICIIYSGYSFFIEEKAENYDFEYSYINDASLDDTSFDDTPSSTSSSAFSNYNLPKHRTMYNQLDSSQKRVYMAIRNALESLENECFISDYVWDRDAFDQALIAVYHDFPEFFWMNGGWRVVRSSSDSGPVDLNVTIGTYEYWDYTSRKNKIISEIMSFAQKTAETISKEAKSDYERVKYLHDFIIRYAEYDYVCLEEVNKTVQRASSQQAHTIYGCLINRSCVCDGYSKTFKLISNLMGIDAELVLGDAGGGHAWNYVILDGKEYWMDITWNENEQTDKYGNLLSPNGALHDYFCVTDDVIYQKHSTDGYFEDPICDSTEYNYFYYNESYLEKYSFDGVENAVLNQKDEDIIQVKFASKKEFEKALSDLFDNKKYKKLSINHDKLNGSYSSSSQLTIIFYFE